jgi:hypothetical protein
LVEEFAGGVVVVDCELRAGDAVVLGRMSMSEMLVFGCVPRR